MVAPSVNLLEILRPSRVVVRVADHPFTLEASTAAGWLGAIATDLDDLFGIMPGLIADDDLETMHDLMGRYPDIQTRWFHAARTALGRAGGRDWWWTHNLARMVLGSWIYVNGILLRQGIDAKTMAFPDWLDACYTMLWQGNSEEDQIKLDFQLSVRPKGIAVKRSRAQMEQEVAAFAAD